MPLGVGKVQPTEGSDVPILICKGMGIESASDSAHVGGWRAWLTAGAPRQDAMHSRRALNRLRRSQQ